MAFRLTLTLVLLCMTTSVAVGADVSRPSVAGQPLAANVGRLLDASEYLGAPLAAIDCEEIRKQIRAEDSQRLQKTIDSHVLFEVSINPESRVKVRRGPADSIIQQAGFTPVLVKVINHATVTRRLRISSPQAGAVYSGASKGILKRQAQTELKENENVNRDHRFLDVEMFEQSPMTARLSGLKVEYLLALIFSSEAGQREATIVFDIGQGTQDLGFRSEVPVLFSIKPAVPLKMRILDFDGQPTTARLEFRDKDNRIYPPQAKRLAPDFFFQPQIYRRNGDTVLLPPGEFELTTSRGPEYLRVTQTVKVAAGESNSATVNLKRWVNPSEFGFYSGDHHIHAAGCSHYDNPTQGVRPQDMFAQVKGEGLNVGCVLTWGPCFDHQRTYFSPIADTISEAQTVLKYDLEISGFGSAALGHVCLLNLNDQTYPGSDGTSTKGWPTWTVPVLRWAKEQGGVTGYPHSALHVDAKLSAQWQIDTLDKNENGTLSASETSAGVLPEPFSRIDENSDLVLSHQELQDSANRAANTLPNFALPSLNGGGAMEIFVSTSEGVCDFISAMDTERIPEWNTWYHLLNCGFPLKLSGETDFPCMSSRRVGQGRVYVQLGKTSKIDFPTWSQGIANGKAYVSDGFAHALHFDVNGHSPGTDNVNLDKNQNVTVRTTVSFAPEHPIAVAHGTLAPAAGRRKAGDTRLLHAERNTGYVKGGTRNVEVVVNGNVVASQTVDADGQEHELEFDISIDKSSWVAVRQFPQLHTNPVNVIVAGAPIRANAASAIWCAQNVRLLWHNRSTFIAASERNAAKEAYKRSLQHYFRIADEAGGGAFERFELE